MLRPGAVTRIVCGHGKDSGARCYNWCPTPTADGAWGGGGPPCDGSWRPADIGIYLQRETLDYRRNPGWGHYNEFIVDGMHWDTHLPLAIEAFLSGRGAAGMDRLHRAFLGRYGLSAEGLSGVPLLTLAPSITRPFVVGATYASQGDPTRLGGQG